MMRTYVITTNGDNDALHRKALDSACAAIESHNTYVRDTAVLPGPLHEHLFRVLVSECQTSKGHFDIALAQVALKKALNADA